MIPRINLNRDRAPGVMGLIGSLVGPLLVAALVTSIAALAFSFASVDQIVLLFGINAILVVGFQVFVGGTGIVSFGHVAFMAIGAYVGGVLAIPVTDKATILPDLPDFLAGVELSMPLALLCAGLAAAAVALVTGFALMRLSGAAASIATLGLLIIVGNVLSQSGSLTRGPQSLYGVPENTNFGWVFGMLFLVVGLSTLYKWSPYGLRARAARDDALAAESSGVSVLRSRLVAFTLSAFITGIGGALYAQLLTAFSPASFYIPQLVVVITMAIIGGIHSITGALAGATVITVLNELMRQVESGTSIFGTSMQLPSGISFAILGVALILILRWRPAGLLGSLEVEVGARAGAGSREGPIDVVAGSPQSRDSTADGR